MAEETKTPPADQKPADDSIKNLKAEFDRKLGNIEKTNQALLNQLTVLNTPKKEPVKEKSLKDIWYDDPEAAARVISQQAQTATLAVIDKQNQNQQKTNTVIQQLYREYPELQDFDTDLTKKSVEIFDKFTAEEKANPIAYRLAVKEAADELDIKPKNKRKAKDDEDDNFSLSGSKGANDKTTRRSKENKGLDPRTVRFAKMVGLDTDNEKVIDSLKNKADRKNWMTWE